MRTVIETADAVRRGDLKAVEVLDECLAAIDKHNPDLNAFVHLDPALARAAAEAVDAKIAKGQDPGLLAGVPFGVKDLEDCAGMPTSQGSLLFKGRPPVGRDSVHVARLRQAGAVPVGKTAAPEFGAVAFTSTPAWGTTRNPWDLARTPGGSSGGSAAAVASGMTPFCTASDGGGSTRIPAAFTGLVGFKASFGRIPTPGAAPSQTTSVGALVTTVADAARHLDVAKGPDDRDRLSLPPTTTVFERAIEHLDVTGLKACWSVDLGFATVDPEVAELAQAAAIELAQAAGLTLVERPIHFTDPVKVWLTGGGLDVWTDIEPDMWPARADEFDRPVRRTLEITQDWTLRRFARSYERRQLLAEEVAAIFDDVDVVLTPSTAIPAFAAEGPMPNVINGEKVNPAMGVPFTMVGNLCWNPAASLPAGHNSEGLPVGVQVMGRRHADDVVLRLARIYEQTRPWPRLAPMAV